MKYILRLLVLFFCAWGVTRFCKKQTSGFTVARITSDLPFHAEWEVAPTLSQEEIKTLLSQPYSFLGKGAQAFVFASEDGETVIKFFRHHRLSPAPWLYWVPFNLAQVSIAKRESKLTKDFTSYTIAYNALREETGLLHLHLNKTSDLHLSLDLVDKLGIHHALALDNYAFVLQKRAKLAYDALQNWIDAGQIEDAKKAISSLVTVLKTRGQKGIYDKDPDLNTNFGFIGTTSIQIDVGRFRDRLKTPSRAGKPALDSQELIRITDNLHQWLMQRCPELDQHLKKELDCEI